MSILTTGIENASSKAVASQVSHASAYRRWGKRTFDVGASIAALVVTSPVLLICSLLVYLASGRPVLFRQARVGRFGHLFKVIKFRTMVNGAELLGAAVVKKGDDRVTPVGSFLRQTKLDELPQLFNVLIGDMSIVGPRPRVPSQVDLDDPREQTLQSVRPGLTSYATVHHRAEADYCARHPDPQRIFSKNLIPQKLELDCEYAKRLSFWLDCRLIFLTFLLVFIPGKSLAKKLRVFGREVCPYSRMGQIILDLGLFSSAVLLAYQLRFDGVIAAPARRQMLLMLAVLPALRTLTNKLLGIYDLMWRYINLADAVVYALSLVPVTAILLGLRLVLPTLASAVALLEVPLSIIALEYLISLSAGLALRGLRRSLYVLEHHYQPLPEASRRRVLILGAGLQGLSAAIDMRRFPHIEHVGFLDDDPSKYDRVMARRRVLGNFHDLQTACLLHKVTDLVICVRSLDPVKLQTIQSQGSNLGVRVHALAGLDQVLQEKSYSFQSVDPVLSVAGSEHL